MPKISIKKGELWRTRDKGVVCIRRVGNPTVVEVVESSHTTIGGLYNVNREGRWKSTGKSKFDLVKRMTGLPAKIPPAPMEVETVSPPTDTEGNPITMPLNPDIMDG